MHTIMNTKLYLSNLTAYRFLGVLHEKFAHTLHDTCTSSPLIMSVLCFALTRAGTIDQCDLVSVTSQYTRIRASKHCTPMISGDKEQVSCKV